MDLKQIRESRSKGVVAYTKFCLDASSNTDSLFCFFEGEDIKYYHERILRYTDYRYEEIISYSCGGKKQVIKAYSLISKDVQFQSIKKAFFIDRDFEPYDIKDKPEIYQTLGYSIENYYTSVEVFKRVLNREFHLNVVDGDYLRCVDDFISIQKCFHDHMTTFNAWVFFQREREREVGKELLVINHFKISRLFSSICIDQIKLSSNINLEYISSIFPDSYPVEIKRIDEITRIFNEQDKQKYFRGKFELQFFKNIIEDLKRKNKVNTYFSSVIENVRIDVGSNPLSSLSQYAETPECLITFLSQYKRTA